MKIELPSMERMSQTGHGLLRIIQNNDLSIMDLFVREAFQNSLDAAIIENDEPVKIDMIYKDFDVVRFSRELECVKDVLIEKYLNTTKYLAIRDSNTTGLTGPMVDEEITTHDYGNLYSLVYGISKPKNTEGAGGSWGLGKTSFFKIGNGLVVYYSRIKKTEFTFESRLVINLVENEKSTNTILPKEKNRPSQGLAWWGEYHRPGRTKPITNEAEIKRILRHFDFPIYEGEETGTSVIIPFVNEEYLLKSHVKQQDNSDLNHELPYWYNDVTDFLEKAIQRWYYPRLENPLYHGKYFKLSINNQKFEKGDMDPIFKVMTDLYNVANPMGPKRNIKNQLNFPNLNYHKDIINTTGFLDSNHIGTLASVKVDKKTLQETIPNNLPNSYLMTGSYNYYENSNSPIIAYTRKPGMIVSYETKDDWLKNVDPTSSDEYILAMFVLNSPNRINKNIISEGKDIRTIEDYIRAGEKADHAKWEDVPDVLNSVVHVIRRITSNVSGSLGKRFNVKKVLFEGETRSVMSGRYGKFLLPQSNFGKRAVKKASKPVNKGNQKGGAKPKFDVITENVEYTSYGVNTPFELTSRGKKVNSMEFDLRVVTETGTLGATSFEDSSIDFPFELLFAKMNITIGKKQNTINFDASKEFNDVQFDIHTLKTKRNSVYGYEIRLFEPKTVDMTGVLEVQTLDKNVKLSVNCYFNMGEDDE